MYQKYPYKVYFFEKIIYLHATYMNSQSCLRNEPFNFHLGEGLFIDVGLVGDNHHKLKLVLSNEGVVPLLWSTSYTPSLSR